MTTCQSIVRNIAYKDIMKEHAGIFTLNCMREKKMKNKKYQRNNQKKKARKRKKKLVKTFKGEEEIEIESGLTEEINIEETSLVTF